MEAKHADNLEPLAQASRTSTPRLLVLDDEMAIADLVTSIFEAEGMQVETFYDPRTALDAAKDAAFDMAIVDVMMPGMDGFEFCRQLKQIKDIPVVFLTAKDDETDIVIGFALGAEDYVTKPFKPRELVARVKTRLRKSTASIQGDSKPRVDSRILSARGIELDLKAHRASLHDIALTLTPKEFDILAILLEHVGQPVSAREIYEKIWQEEANASSSNTIMVHIRHIRCKLAEIDSSEEFIETAWGVGYRIAEE